MQKYFTDASLWAHAGLAVVLLGSVNAHAASASTRGCLGVPGYGCIFDSEYANGPLSQDRREHDGTLVPADAGFTADVDGFADIGSGELSSNGHLGSDADEPSQSGLDGGVIYGGSGFSDELSFVSTLGGASYDVTLNLTVTGTIMANGATLYAGSYLTLDNEFDDGSYTGDGSINDVLTVTVSLTGDQVLDVSADLEYSVDFYAAMGASTSVELYAVLELILPAGVSYTSESEFFLASPIPVPGVLPLVGIFLAGLAAKRRRKTF